MNRAFGPGDLTAVWAGGLALGALTLHFVFLLRDAGVRIDVRRPTKLLFAAAAWVCWALNVASGLLILVQVFLAPLPINPWVLGAVFSPMALPIGQMYQLLRTEHQPEAATATPS